MCVNILAWKAYLAVEGVPRSWKAYPALATTMKLATHCIYATLSEDYS